MKINKKLKFDKKIDSKRLKIDKKKKENAGKTEKDYVLIDLMPEDNFFTEVSELKEKSSRMNVAFAPMIVFIKSIFKALLKIHFLKLLFDTN